MRNVCEEVYGGKIIGREVDRAGEGNDKPYSPNHPSQ